jgi:hypothetical protein
MKIRLTIDDKYLYKYWNLRKGGTYEVQEIEYANKANKKKKRTVKGYKVRAKVLMDCKSKGQFVNISIKAHECIVIRRKRPAALITDKTINHDNDI